MQCPTFCSSQQMGCTRSTRDDIVRPAGARACASVAGGNGREMGAASEMNSSAQRGALLQDGDCT
jgi:hypothetical protein